MGAHKRSIIPVGRKEMSDDLDDPNVCPFCFVEFPEHMGHAPGCPREAEEADRDNEEDEE